MARGRTRPPEVGAWIALILFLFLTGGVQTWLAFKGAKVAFPASAAVAIVVGNWLDSVDYRGQVSRTAAGGILALLVILFDDFSNIPDEVLAATASAQAHIPLSFRPENLAWLRFSVALMAISVLIAGVQFGDPDVPRRTVREIAQNIVSYVRQIWGGQLMFLLLLVETSLITGAALVVATRMGVPFQRIRAMSAVQRQVLTWAWLGIFALLVLGVVLVLARDTLQSLFAPGFRLPQCEGGSSYKSRWAARILRRFPRVRTFTLSRSIVLGVGCTAAGLLLSIGWASRLSQQLSPRRALSRYNSLAKPGEPLGLLGVRPQITQYYSYGPPELLEDADEGADWLLHGSGSSSRWLLVKGDQFPRLNAAFRERCHCMRNVPVIDGRSSEMFLVSNRLPPGVKDENPLNSIVLDQRPNPQQKLSGDFGGQVEAIGWEIVTESGRPVAELSIGRTYQLRLYYRVISRPTLDWETFVHIDGFGRRYNGDHQTTRGKYPMTDWRAGDFIVDSEHINLDPSFSGGNYTLYFGFFRGSRRLQVRAGRNDDNRLIAGTIHVR
jgi:hypothetical protein